MTAAESPPEGETTSQPPSSSLVFRANGTHFPTDSRPNIEPVDFRNPTPLAEGELRRLRTMHHEYVRALTSRLSSLLRSELALNLESFTTQSNEAFIEGLNNPSQISLFRVTPLNGVGFIEVPPKMAIAWTNRILGGREPAGKADAYLTEIEIALLEDVIAIITAEWCEQWQDAAAMTAHLIGHETNPRFLQTTGKNVMLLVAGIEVAFGRITEIIQVAVPLSMIEPMMKRLEAVRVREAGQQRAEKNSAWRPNYDDIAIPVHAEMVAARMTIASLLKLKEGDIIELPASALDAALINVAGVQRFTGKAGQKDGKTAVQITANALTLKK